MSPVEWGYCRLNILEVTPAFHPATAYGGPIESTLQLLVALADKGCSIRVITSDANGEARLATNRAWTAIRPRVEVRYLRRWGAGTLAPMMIGVLLWEIRKANIVHLTGVYSFPTLPTLLLCRIFRRPVIWSPRGSLQEWSGTRKRLLKSIWIKACAIAMPSHTRLHVTSEREASESIARLPHARPFIVPNGIVQREEQKEPPTGGAMRMIFLGRIDPIKNIDGLLRACALAQVSDWHLSVVGGGDRLYVSELKRLAVSLGISGRVSFVGPVFGSDKYSLLSRHNVLILPSHSENFGMVVLEALSLGIPVIASTGTPWKDLEMVGCGRWVDGSPESLARAIEMMRAAPLGQMGLLGRRWVANAFTWSSIAEQMMNECKSLIETARDGRSGAVSKNDKR